MLYPVRFCDPLVQEELELYQATTPWEAHTKAPYLQYKRMNPLIAFWQDQARLHHAVSRKFGNSTHPPLGTFQAGRMEVEFACFWDESRSGLKIRHLSAMRCILGDKDRGDKTCGKLVNSPSSVCAREGYE